MKKLALLFSGQGAQKPGMGRELYEYSPAVRQLFQLASLASNRDLQKICFDTDASELALTVNTQPAVFMTDMAAWTALQEAGVRPSMTAGFSLGEYAALVAAGGLTIPEAIRLVCRRAEFMAGCENDNIADDGMAERGGMLAVLGMENATLETMCRQIGQLWPANYNAPGQTVVAGEVSKLAILRERLREEKIRSVPLQVSGAFHSPMMNQAAEMLKKELEKTHFHPLQLPMVFNATGGGLDEPLAAIMARQCCSPVYWQREIEQLLVWGADVFVECGAGGVLTGLCKRICPQIPAYRVEDVATLREAIDKLSPLMIERDSGTEELGEEE